MFLPLQAAVLQDAAGLLRAPPLGLRLAGELDFGVVAIGMDGPAAAAAGAKGDAGSEALLGAGGRIVAKAAAESANRSAQATGPLGGEGDTAAGVGLEKVSAEAAAERRASGAATGPTARLGGVADAAAGVLRRRLALRNTACWSVLVVNVRAMPAFRHCLRCARQHCVQVRCALRCSGLIAAMRQHRRARLPGSWTASTGAKLLLSLAQDS